MRCRAGWRTRVRGVWVRSLGVEVRGSPGRWTGGRALTGGSRSIRLLRMLEALYCAVLGCSLSSITAWAAARNWSASMPGEVFGWLSIFCLCRVAAVYSIVDVVKTRMAVRGLLASGDEPAVAGRTREKKHEDGKNPPVYLYKERKKETRKKRTRDGNPSRPVVKLRGARHILEREDAEESRTGPGKTSPGLSTPFPLFP